MALIFQGEQTCSRCGCKYEWVTTQFDKDKDEVVIGIIDRMWKNVKNCTRMNQTNFYSIEIGCPECDKREFVMKEI